MTFVGKILVLVITALALVFLGVGWNARFAVIAGAQGVGAGEAMLKDVLFSALVVIGDGPTSRLWTEAEIEKRFPGLLLAIVNAHTIQSKDEAQAKKLTARKSSRRRRQTW